MLYWEFDTKESYGVAQKTLQQLLKVYRKVLNSSA